MFQIAAKIGGDGVAAPTGSEFGYGGQKRPLEDAGGYFPMPNLNIGQWQICSAQVLILVLPACVCLCLAAYERNLLGSVSIL